MLSEFGVRGVGGWGKSKLPCAFNERGKGGNGENGSCHVLSMKGGNGENGSCHVLSIKGGKGESGSCHGETLLRN